MTIEFTTTRRHFGIGHFRDRYDKRCTIQESSLATECCIWLGTDDERMHLTQEHVMDLLPALHHFVETGSLPRKSNP